MEDRLISKLHVLQYLLQNSAIGQQCVACSCVLLEPDAFQILFFDSSLKIIGKRPLRSELFVMTLRFQKDMDHTMPYGDFFAIKWSFYDHLRFWAILFTHVTIERTTDLSADENSVETRKNAIVEFSR